MLRPAPPAQQQQQQEDLTQPPPIQPHSIPQKSSPHKRNMSKGSIVPFPNQNNPYCLFQGGLGVDLQHQFYPHSTPVFVEDSVGGDDSNQALKRPPPPAHRSPNGRAKWSPVVHTIAEAGESFSGTVFPAKLFNDDTSNNYELSPHDKNTDNGQEACGAASPLAPSLEPHTSSTTCKQTGPKTKNEVPSEPAPAPAPALNDEKDENQEVIPMDILLNEIQRLVVHDFGGPNKSASYPTVLKPLYQRLHDYHVMLKNARRKLDQQHQQQQQQQQRVALSPMTGGLSAGSEASSNKLNLAVIATTASTAAAAAARSVNRNISTSVSTPVASSFTSSTRAMIESGPDGPPSGGHHQLQQRIVDLEQQLAQSRRAHHTLLQDHILNLEKTSSNFLIGSPASGPGGVGGGNVATAKLPLADARAIHGILASVNSDSPSTRPLFSSSTTTTSSSSATAASGNNNKSKKKKKDSSSSLKKESSNTVEMPLNETFQETIKTAQELHNRHIRQLKGLPSVATTTTTTTAFADPINNNNNNNNNNNTNDLSTTALLSSSDSDPSLVSISSHHLISEATTRLLRAETELGLLKLVMAQNQSEICGLEEDVLRAQHELKTHRQVFESLLELHQLGFEAQIREDQCQIKGLEGQVKRLEEEKEEAERVVKKLEEGLAEKEKMLDKKRDTYHRQEQDLIQGPVRDLEAEIELLKGELVAQEVRMTQTEEESSQMTEFLERQHRKVAAGLKASLIKAHRSNIRLQKEVSGLAKKMVTIEGLNDEYTEQTSRDRAQLSALQQQTRDLQALLDNAATSSSSSSTGSTVTIQQQNELKATITSLETQIEDLSTSLRLKQEELDQALEETERLALKLDHDLAHQQSNHVLALSALTEKHNLQAQRERACQSASVTLFQNMVIKLQAELGDTQEKLRDTTLCWGHTKEQLQKCEQSYKRRKKDLEETTRNLRELEETMARLGDAIGMLEYEKEANMVLVRTLEERDREMRDMEYRLKVLEDERD